MPLRLQGMLFHCFHLKRGMQFYLSRLDKKCENESIPPFFLFSCKFYFVTLRNYVQMQETLRETYEDVYRRVCNLQHVRSKVYIGERVDTEFSSSKAWQNNIICCLVLDEACDLFLTKVYCPHVGETFFLSGYRYASAMCQKNLKFRGNVKELTIFSFFCGEGEIMFKD